jgi:hypothetical protein
MSKVFPLMLALIFSLQGRAMAQGTSDRWTIQELVSRYTLGITQKYAEFKIGSPAITEKTDSLGIQRNLYKVGQCLVTLGIKNSEVVSVRMNASKAKCDLDVSDEFLSKRRKMLTDTTFDDWAQRFGTLHFTDPDIPGCNACEESDFDVYGRVDASGVFGMIEVQVGGDSSGTAASKGHEAWREMLSRAGIDGNDLPISGLDCPLRQFDTLAFQLMKTAKIISIGFGRPNTLQPECSAVTDQKFSTTGDFIEP